MNSIFLLISWCKNVLFASSATVYTQAQAFVQPVWAIPLNFISQQKQQQKVGEK